MRAEHCGPVLVGSAHLIRVGCGAGVLLMRQCVIVAAVARPLWRLRRYQSSPLLECVKRARRINAWRSSDKLDHLLELGSAEFSRDLLNASLMQQQDSRDNGFGHALSGGPSDIIWMKEHPKTIRHCAGIYSVAPVMHHQAPEGGPSWPCSNPRLIRASLTPPFASPPSAMRLAQRAKIQKFRTDR